MNRVVNAKIRGGILIPLRNLEEKEIEALQKENTWHQYKDAFQCRGCENNDEKPAYCGGCENYTKHEFYKRKVVKGTPVIIIRKGYRRRLERFFKNELKLKDMQTTVPMKNQKYRFDESMLNAGQYEAKNVLVDKISAGYSCILKSPARTGKTVMAAAIVLALARRTLFIAHQEDLLIGKGQLMSTFLEKTGANAPINPNRYFTNLHKFIDKGEEPIKYARTLEDFLESDICLTTYQIFLHPRGQKILEQISDKFGLLVVDEAHKSASDEYSKVLDRFACPRLGLSATPKRKDGRERVMHSIFGKVEHETSIDSLKPKVSVVRTGFKSNRNYKNWVYFLRFLESQQSRVDKLLAFAYKDVKKNGRSILIPVAHHSQVDSLVEQLNDIGLKAIGWDGRLKKKERHIPLEKSAKGEVDVLVAQRSMLTGINIPRWDTLYWFVPMSNDPNFEQEYKRICTPMPNKNDPVVRFFVDDYEIVERCFFNSARVIKSQGGQFTQSAALDWQRVGERFGKLSPPKPKRTAEESCKTKKANKSSYKAPMSLWGENLEVDEPESSEKPKKAKPKRRTTRELFSGVL